MLVSYLSGTVVSRPVKRFWRFRNSRIVHYCSADGKLREMELSTFELLKPELLKKYTVSYEVLERNALHFGQR